MTHYSIIQNSLSNRKSYGVKVIKEKTIKNISDDYSIVKFLVDTCNKFGVDFEHFEDILENFAEDYKTF